MDLRQRVFVLHGKAIMIPNVTKSNDLHRVYDPEKGSIEGFVQELLIEWDGIPKTSVTYPVRQIYSGLCAKLYKGQYAWIAITYKAGQPSGKAIVISLKTGKSRLIFYTPESGIDTN